jgi:hypothetical protein
MRQVDLKLQIIHANEFLRLTERGVMDLAASRQALDELARAACSTDAREILIDAREAVKQRSIIDSWDLAADLENHKADFVGRKIAILVNGTGEAVEFFKLCAQNRGYYVNVFRDYEAAINWLFLPTDVSPQEPKEQAHG